jgi:L-arabinose isomerase
MTRVMVLMGVGLNGGSAFMEDYTYHLEAGNEMILGAHMLEVSPVVALASAKPEIQVHPLGIGGRKPPARLVFKAKPGEAIVCSLVDMGNRFRMIVNDIDCVPQEKDMPKLPVAGVLWKPRPNMITSAEAWIIAGAAHHSTLSYDLTAEHMRDLAEMFGIEFVHINDKTTVVDLKKELLWNEAAYNTNS